MIQCGDTARAKRGRASILSGATVGAIALAANTALSGLALALFKQDPPSALDHLLVPGRALAILLIHNDLASPLGGISLLALCTVTNALGGFVFGAAVSAMCILFRALRLWVAMAKFNG